ncbi:protein OSCP1 [Pelomyxa schiedti]|nr:protein OSCP1 [Pelomyxa schiedti]
MQELFRPQELYTLPGTRLVFERLVNTSAMNLNAQSMDKLFDVMLMSFKYQVMSACCADDLASISSNHIKAMIQMVTVDTPLVQVLASLSTKITVDFAKLTPGDALELRMSLLQLLQDKKVKVSGLLLASKQTPKGTLLRDANVPLDKFTEVPGTIRYFDFRGNVIKTDYFTVSCELAERAPNYSTSLGTNMYCTNTTPQPTIEPPKAPSPTASPTKPEISPSASPTVPSSPQSKAAPKADVTTLRKISQDLNKNSPELSKFANDLVDLIAKMS